MMEAASVLGAMLLAIGMNSQNLDKVKAEEFICMADNVFFEARSEDRKGREAVAYVTLHRVLAPGYPESFCDVVREKKKQGGKDIPMFSWTLDGKSDKIPENERHIWKECLEVAVDVILRRVPDPTESIGGATHFYAHKIVSPTWAASAKATMKIGNHTFARLSDS